MGTYLGPSIRQQMQGYSDLEIALGQKIYEQRHAKHGGDWRGVETVGVWFEYARELLQFIDAQQGSDS
jgi:hypothetical protein